MAKKGRPLQYQTEFAAQARILAAAGATQGVIAARLGVEPSTVTNWKKEYPEFEEALRTGRELHIEMQQVRKVESALYKRARGYEIVEEHTEPDPDNPEQQRVSRRVTKHIPGDVRAQQFFLINRSPEKWKQRQEVTGADGRPIEMTHTVSENISRLLEVLGGGSSI